MASFLASSAKSLLLLSLLFFTSLHQGFARYQVLDFQAPGPSNIPANTTLIGVYSYVRSFGSSAAGGQDNSVLLWCLPFVAKSALIAWRDGLILPPPERKAATDFDLLFLDECRSADNCTSGRTLDLATRMMLGDTYKGQQFPAVKAMIGGQFFTEAVAKQAEAMMIPNVGFASQAEEFSDKTLYPMFMRVCGSTAQGKVAIVKVLKQLSYSKALLWMCNNADMGSDRDVFLTSVGPQIGVTLTALIMPRSGVNGCLPADPAIYSQWTGNLRAARESGVHAHIGWWSIQCPTYDIMHWLAHEGLVSRGHFWIGGDTYLVTLYKGTYYPLVKVQMCPIGAPAEKQYLTPFASPRGLLAFDGYTILQNTVNDTNFKRWFSWFQTLKPRKDELFEPWYADRIPEAAWQSLSAAFWRQQWMRFLFDGVWIVLRNINAMLLENRTDINGKELLERIRNDTFDGLSGRLQFDSRGDRVGDQSVAQWRHNCPSERRLEAEQEPEVPLESTSGPEFEALRTSLQRMAERQALARGGRRVDASPELCAPPSAGDAAALPGYLSCLQQRCIDAAPAVVLAVTGNRIGSCPAAKAIVPSCDTDLSTFGLPVPAGTKFSAVCPGQCPCGAAGATTAAPSVTSTAAAGTSSLPRVAPSPGPAPAPVTTVANPGYVTVGNFRDTLVLTRPLLFFQCTSQVPPDSDLPCDPGSFYDADAAACLYCPKGTASSLRGQSFCSACPGGMFGASEGQSVCQACTSGKFSLDGATNCTNCAAGTYTADVQQTQCLDCSAGKYAASTGTTDCPRCAAGSYQARGGQTTCELCPSDQVTLYPGSTAAADCTCAPGFYWKEGTCHRCDEAFPLGTVACAGDRSPPMVKTGFMTLNGDLDVFLCRSTDACPGGVPVGQEHCGEGGSGVACARCLEGKRYDMRDGSCVQCSRWAVAVFWSLAVLGFLALAFKLRSTEEEYGISSLTGAIKAMFVSVPISQCGDLLQFHSVLGKSAIRWPQEVSPTFASLSGVLEFRSFSVECFLGADKDTYPMRYVVLANLLPLFMIMSCLLLALPALMNRGLRKWRFPDPLRATSAALSVMLALFLTVLNWALNLVFSTYPHPEEALRSLQSFPHVLTTDSSMATLQGIAIAAVLVWCAGTFALVTFLLHFLPRRRDHMFLRRCTLAIVARFTEDKAWWVLVEMITKILTCITLSIFDTASSQLVWLGCVYTSYLFLTTLSQPYRFARHAVFDIVLTFGKVLVIIFAIPLIEGNGGGNAFGATCVTYAFYGLGGAFVAWSLADRLRGRACDVEKEQLLFDWLRNTFHRILPLQDSVEELVSTADSLRISKLSSIRRSQSSPAGSEEACSSSAVRKSTSDCGRGAGTPGLDLETSGSTLDLPSPASGEEDATPAFVAISV